MGKRIIQQRRGRGTTTYRAHSFRWKTAVKYRDYDEAEKNSAIKGIVIDLIHCAGHSAPLAKIKLENGEETFIFAPEGIQTESVVEVGLNASIKPGNILPLKSLPEGTDIFNIEIKPGDGGKLVRSGGTSAKVINKTPESITLQLPSKKTKILQPDCRATIGIVSGAGRSEKPFVKAGNVHHLMRSRGKLYPRTSPGAMNAGNHPFGSGRGGPTYGGKASNIAPRNAPPGRKVGLLRPKTTGRGKKRNKEE
ncbi:MAG: 50S ribosomal protein L2 [Candidatus Woesearchaeota archaeon]|nr:MAG: 50S ribosomal protein L2 [Candidatus Woesearchaeota archaeon]